LRDLNKKNHTKNSIFIIYVYYVISLIDFDKLLLRHNFISRVSY